MFVSDVLKNVATAVTVTLITSVGFGFWAIFLGWIVLRTRNAQKLVTFYLASVLPPAEPGANPLLSLWPFHEDEIANVVNNRYLAKQILRTAKLSPNGDPVLRFPLKTRNLILDSFVRRAKMSFADQGLLRDQKEDRGPAYLMFAAYERTECLCRTQLRVILIRPEVLSLFLDNKKLDLDFEQCYSGECVAMLRAAAGYWKEQQSVPSALNHFRQTYLTAA